MSDMMNGSVLEPGRPCGSARPSESVSIERMSYGSAAVGRLSDGKTVFVEGAAPGDVVEVEVVEDKRTYARGRISRIVEASPQRADMVKCSEACGGCPWAHLSYEAQLTSKRDAVIDALCRVAHFDRARAVDVVAPCVASKRQWGYRNKLEMAAGKDSAGRFTLGFYREGTHDVVSVKSCPLANRYIERAPKALRGALRFLSSSQDLGIYRVGVRSSLRTGKTEVALWTPPSAFPRTAVAKTIQDALRASSVVRVLAEPGSARKVKKIEALEGKGVWEEKLCDARFFTAAPSFFQVNTAQAEKLVNLVIEGLEIEQGMYIADLYAGGGTFSIPMARLGADVVAVEVAGSSIRDLRRNAEVNNVELEAICGDTAVELPELGELDVLVVDPPRSGLAKGVVGQIAAAAPARVAYVSCDPQTWARDVALFEGEGYRLARATPVDMFPQTYHVEVASIFERVR